METIRKCIIHIVRIIRRENGKGIIIIKAHGSFDTSVFLLKMFINIYMDNCCAVKRVAKVEFSKIKPENDWNNRLIKVEYF